MNRPKSNVQSPGIRYATCDFRLVTDREAFTLIELIVIIVILGIVVFALVMGIHQSLRSVGLHRDLRSASLLIEDLMNEIRSKQYIQSYTNVGTNRVSFDYVDDYAGWSETPPKTIEGVILSNYNGFTRRVFVANVSNDFISPAPTNSDFKRITVVVSNAEIAVSNVSVVSRYD